MIPFALPGERNARTGNVLRPVSIPRLAFRLGSSARMIRRPPMTPITPSGIKTSNRDAACFHPPRLRNGQSRERYRPERCSKNRSSVATNGVRFLVTRPGRNAIKPMRFNTTPTIARPTRHFLIATDKSSNDATSSVLRDLQVQQSSTNRSARPSTPAGRNGGITGSRAPSTTHSPRSPSPSDSCGRRRRTL